MNRSVSFLLVLFPSVNQTMWADSILRKSGIPHKMIPIPRDISADCGVCIRVESGHAADVEKALGEIPLEWSIRPV